MYLFLLAAPTSDKDDAPWDTHFAEYHRSGSFSCVEGDGGVSRMLTSTIWSGSSFEALNMTSRTTSSIRLRRVRSRLRASQMR